MRPAALNDFQPLFLAVLLTLHACASDDGPTQPPPTPAPVISTVSASVVRTGDLITIAGQNFSADPDRNRVVFNNELAKAVPDMASVDTLVVTVPENANSGAMYVVTSGQRSGTVAIEVQRNVGEVWAVGGGQNYEFKLPAPSGSEEYVLIACSAAAGAAQDYSYTITPDTTSQFPLHAARRPSPRLHPELSHRFEEHRWRQASAHSERAISWRRTAGARSTSGPQPTRDFLVVNCAGATCDPTLPINYVTVTANLQATRTHVLVYADVNQPSGGFAQSDYDAFAALFDTQLFPTDTMAFAPATDIDTNGRVIVVFTPQVNELTPDGTAQSGGAITGFFQPNDLAPDWFASTTNDGEILYLMVPDPTGERGNVFTKSRVDSIIPAVASHELEHVLSYGYRFITLGNSSEFGLVQDRWLEEGMAHVAEDLNDIDFANVERVNRYFVDPGAASLKGQDVVEQRGGIFMFLRYLGDRFGDGVYRDIVQTVCRGEFCVEMATGEDFYQMVQDFLAALYLSQRGITSAPRFNYTSFDIQNDFDALAIMTRAVADGAFGGQVQTAAGDYYLLTGLQAPATVVRVAGESSSAQIRTIVVRTK